MRGSGNFDFSEPLSIWSPSRNSQHISGHFGLSLMLITVFQGYSIFLTERSSLEILFLL
jgi:hypothetical protein